MRELLSYWATGSCGTHPTETAHCTHAGIDVYFNKIFLSTACKCIRDVISRDFILPRNTQNGKLLCFTLKMTKRTHTHP